MALPQNPFGDTILLNTLKTQNENLGAQTKVLHNLSDSIKDQRREFAELRKDIQKSQRDFFTGSQNGMESIKKYFEKNKSDTKSGAKGKEDTASTGFFKSAINKLFGPSKYQQKMMDEITRVRELTESSALSLSFIKSTFDDGPRRRERELLAKLIAEKLGEKIEDTQGGGGKGLMSTLLDAVVGGGTLLVGFLGSVVVPLIGSVIATLGAVGSSIVAAIASLASAMAMGGGGMDMPDRGGKGGRGRYNPNQLPNGAKDVPQLEGPRKPIDMGELKQNRSGTYTPGGTGGGIPKLGWVGIAAAVAASIAGSDEIQDKFKPKEDTTATGESPSLANRWKSIKWFDDENGKGDKMSEAFNKMVNPAKVKVEESQDALENQTEKLTDTSKKMTDSIQQMLKDFEDFPKKMEKALVDKVVDAKDFIVNELNHLGEINFGPGPDGSDQMLNLLPGLGTAAFDTLKEAYDQTEAMANKVTPNASMFSNNITQNIDSKGTTISASQITAEGLSTTMMNPYRWRNARIR